MNAKPNILGLLLLFAINFGCRKDPIISTIPPDDTLVDLYDTTFIHNYSLDTVLPSDYLMSYPGSWWEYSNGQTDSCLEWSTLDIFTTSTFGYNVTVSIDKRIYPKTNSGYISNESRIYQKPDSATTLFPKILSQIEGAIISNSTTYLEGPNGYVTTTISNINNLDSLEVLGVVYYDVIVIENTSAFHYYHLGGSGPVNTYFFYYAKNVGKIRQIKDWTSFPIDTINLVNHYIEPY